MDGPLHNSGNKPSLVSTDDRQSGIYKVKQYSRPDDRAFSQLWKQQFIQEYGRLRLRGSRGFLAKHETRDIKPLPAHAKNKERKSEEIDWKWMFRISRNWRKGVLSPSRAD